MAALSFHDAGLERWHVRFPHIAGAKLGIEGLAGCGDILDIICCN
eukprot:SAG31_NODE_3543_length_4142_cov_11.404622_4_plen_45_part_00